MTSSREIARIATPIGMVEIEADEHRLYALRIGGATAAPVAPASAAGRVAADQLAEWFSGERRGFDLPLAPARSTRGETLRAGLVAIPYATTLSYGALAGQLGSGARAIGQLCARNPFPIVVPCHRVLAAGGGLGAYSGGGGGVTKQWLLDHEARVAGGQAAFTI